MIARSAPPFTLRSLISRVGLAPAIQDGGRTRRWQGMIEALEDWWTMSTSPGEAKLRRATTGSDSADFVEIAVRRPRISALMSSVSAGMPKYSIANIAANRG
jgi:hypothetical protein